MKKVEFWLVTTAHLEDGLWFRDDDDFRVAMNYVAIQARSGNVSILAFILMSNHVHFVMRGAREDVEAFMVGLKHRYSLYVYLKYGIRELLRRNDVDIKLVPNEVEALERAIAYVLMNCVAANICSHSSQYPWGTGCLYFNPSKPAGRRFCSLSEREKERLLHSNFVDIPDDWLICDDGYLIPHNFVDIKAVEARFSTPKRMNYFLTNSSKAKKRIDTAEDHQPAFRDQTILAMMPELCRSLFGKNMIDELRPEEQTELIRQIRYRFSSNVNQVARICGLSYADAAKIMDGAY